MFCKCFLPFHRLPFHLVMVSFAVKKLFCLHSSIHLFLLLLSLLLVSNPRNYCQGQCQGAYYLCFLLGVLWFQVSHSSFNPFWADYCVWCKIWVHLHSSARGYPVFPTPFIEETILSPLSILLLLSNISWSYIQEFISGLSILFHWSVCLYLCQYHTVLVTIAV